MQVRRLTLSNYRGVREGTVLLPGHCLLVGANSVGKSTLCEALDLVLGPDRMFRRPVVDEFDFYRSCYQTEDGERPQVRIEALLGGLSPAAQRRFAGHLRRWSPTTQRYLDLDPDQLPAATALDLPDGQAEDYQIKSYDDAVQGDQPGEDQAGEWCLPVVFLGRFEPVEDDFAGATFFAHPQRSDDGGLGAGEAAALGQGLRPFTREDKRLCGFLYLRAHRTGNRALSFQRGSLVDTLIRLQADTLEQQPWEQVLRDLHAVDTTSKGTAFADLQSDVRSRVAPFLRLHPDSDAVDVHPSDLTREHVREVLRLFVATQPGEHAVPANRLSTGSVNVLVFALLTHIAELKGDDNVIFAMEEPEIALPPHQQRRLVDFIVNRMGQAIVTSHSPYVIEMFDPADVVVLHRDDDGLLSSSPVALPADFKPKRYRDNRRQFAEAVLARGVLVVEGSTEGALLAAVADALAEDTSIDYVPRTSPD